ncbi:hypothetical protein ABUK73_16920 [Agrobacterium sp. BA1120]|uniref:hypothetical protein n=1 Tax=Agrobacterium sp. BA1120 TaxID=3228927 RepID=UPI00336AA98B
MTTLRLATFVCKSNGKGAETPGLRRKNNFDLDEITKLRDYKGIPAPDIGLGD